MVLEIRLSNFFSIKDEIVLDFRAGNIKTQKARSLSGNTLNSIIQMCLKLWQFMVLMHQEKATL